MRTSRAEPKQPPAHSEPLGIGAWVILPALDRIERNGVSHKLEPRTMRLLLALAHAGGAVVSTESLLATVWAGVVVTSSSLYESVSRLRRLLGRDAQGNDAIESVPRKGYRLRWAPRIEGEPSLGGRSIAVLPFEAVGLDAAMDFLPQMLTDRLIGELSRNGDLAVVARGTMLRLAGRRETPAALARELGVRSIVDGRIRQVDAARLWIEVELIDAPSGRQTWAETIELACSEWPHGAEIVVGRLARALTFEFHGDDPRSGATESTQALSARSLAARAWVELFARPENAQTNALAHGWAAEALERDPRCGLAEICLATCAWRAAQFGWDDVPAGTSLASAFAHAERALALSPDEPDAHYVLALAAHSSGETVRAEEALRDCIRLSASFAPAFGLLGLVRMRLGFPEETPALCARAFALSPHEPMRAVWYLALAWSALARRDYEAALEASQRGMAVNPALPTNYAAGAAAAQALGQTALATKWVGYLRERSPFRTVRDFMQRMPVATAAAHRRQMQAAARWLAKAGLPPE